MMAVIQQAVAHFSHIAASVGDSCKKGRECGLPGVRQHDGEIVRFTAQLPRQLAASVQIEATMNKGRHNDTAYLGHAGEYAC